MVLVHHASVLVKTMNQELPMISLRGFLLLSVAVLLTGCTVPCAPPNLLASDPAPSCFYQLKVTSVDMNNHLVKGQLPETVHKNNDEENNFPARISTHFGKEFTFRVRDLDKLGNQLQLGKTYEFIRLSNSAYLELLAGGPIN